MMPGIWFSLIAAMLVTYAVLDGFDFGAGIVHLLVAKTDDERRQVFGAIGPVWDGNEVWLIASGGVFVFAFPKAYAAAFSGLYLPLMMVLWLLVLRGIAIELRSKVDHPLWRTALDTVFAFASTVMALVLGVALGNVLRGVPLDASGTFQEDLFSGIGFGPATSDVARTAAAHTGALDAYTVLVGLFAVVTLGAHGATFLVWKTDGEVNARAKKLGTRLWLGALGFVLAVTVATALTQPAHFSAFLARPWLYPLPLLAFGSGVLARASLVSGKELRAFVASCTFVAAWLVATAGTLYPNILRSTVAPAFDLDVHRAASPHATLSLGLFVWVPAMALATGYFVYLYRSVRGKVALGDAGHD